AAPPAGRRRWTDPLLWWAAVATAYAAWVAVVLLLGAGGLVVDLGLAGTLSGLTALLCRRAARVPGLAAPLRRFWWRAFLTLLLSMLGLLVEAGCGLGAGQASLRRAPPPASLLSLAGIAVRHCAPRVGP